MPTRLRRPLLDLVLAAAVSWLERRRPAARARLSDVTNEREIRYHENELRRLRRSATTEGRGWLG